MAIFSADQVIGKTLYAKKRLNKRRFPDLESEILGSTEIGEEVGKVFSFVNNKKDLRLWWMFYTPDNKPFYVAQKEGNFSQEALKQQGAKDIIEVAKDKADKDKTWYEKAAESASESASNTAGTIKTVAIGAAVLFALYFVSKIISNVKK